ncbi:hypothetical protein [Streptomyces sp. Inha503]|uniref:hypothetical protein n=1 Tax=Streptomyces sp. Inha503 TaxID=3383314 RepID=UPI0039A21DE7
MIQRVQLNDPHPQGTGAHTFPLGPLPYLMQPEAAADRSDHYREEDDPPVHEQPLHDGDHHDDRHSPGGEQSNLRILLLGAAYRPTTAGTPRRALAAHRAVPGRTHIGTAART